MTIDKECFLQVLREPTRLAEFDLRHWDAFLPMANQIEMLPHMVARLDAAGLSDSLPSRIGLHLESARLRSRQLRRVVYWEVGQLDSLLANTGIPIVLLKGAAYLLSALDISIGRVYSDIDVMVPKASIEEVAGILKRHGWEQPEELTHQEKYFQRWMHELLPLIHKRRGTKLDVHHNILPSIDSLQFDAKTLFENARPIKEGSRIHTLAPADMVLHNIIHIFRNGDYHRALRDLVDLDQLLEEFSRQDQNFFDTFMSRADELNLLTPCNLAFRYVSKYLDTRIPAETIARVEKGKPVWPPVWAIDRLFEFASLPTPLIKRENARRFSLWSLQHYPLNLLRKTILPKLERKGVVLMDPKH